MVIFPPFLHTDVSLPSEVYYSSDQITHYHVVLKFGASLLPGTWLVKSAVRLVFVDRRQHFLIDYAP